MTTQTGWTANDMKQHTELEAAVTSAFRNMVDSGAIQAIIEKKLSETVDSILSDSLRSYSEFGKKLRASVESALNVDLSDLGLPGYNEMVLEVVRRKISERLFITGKEKIERDMEELLGSSAPAEITLSKLVEDFIDFVKEDTREEYGRVTVIVDPLSKHGYRHIYFDNDGDKEKYSCRHRIMLDNEGVPFSVRIDGLEVGKALFSGRMTGFEKTLFQMYATKAKIIVDDEEPDLSWGDY